MEDLIGKELGLYQIEEKIGEGGMAAVFKAYQSSLDRYVAIKVLSPAFANRDDSFTKRFEREAKSIAQLSHRNILPVFDFGLDKGYSYIVMQYVAGGITLANVMQEAIPQAHAVDLIKQMAQALDYAHQHNVIHRDVKPVNALIDNGWMLLSDFGLAKISNSTEARLTQTGIGMGTPAYMSPEQGYGKDVDHRTDIYALGIILYEMFTGIIPHEADTPFGIILKRNTEAPTSPRTLNQALPESVAQVIMRALAINPSDRYQTGLELATALQSAIQDPNYREVKQLDNGQTMMLLDVASNNQSTQEDVVTDNSTVLYTTQEKPIPTEIEPSPSNPPPLAGKPTTIWQNPVWFGITVLLLLGMGLWALFGRSSMAITPTPIRLTSTSQTISVLESATPTIVKPSTTPTKMPDTVKTAEMTKTTISLEVTKTATKQATKRVLSATATMPPATQTPTPKPSPTVLPISPILFATEIQPNYQPLTPTTVFSGSTQQIYASFRYANMQAGESWRQVWSLDDVVQENKTDLWQQGEHGQFAIAYEAQSGEALAAGVWHLQIYTDLTFMQEATFTVKPRPTATPRPTRAAPQTYEPERLILWQDQPQGSIGAGKDKWFQFDSGGNPDATLIAFLQNADHVELVIYNGKDIPTWPPGNADTTPNLGIAADTFDRDNDAQTKEIIWQGRIEHFQLFYARLVNRGGRTVQYCLQTRPDVATCP
ncbi:serine/threonine-protein kinase [Anaerolineales bacterium HSG6]|nr:serine/threonine-protein kinase [Anaerolineales bacterium HSG6]